ncbi:MULTISPECIES: hypothetical protein [Citrobacter]|jgi:hypothetical protein|uniref:Uncharacterized protein n=1 Tax=Citrobacter portucalensis TaxID=1639133 RepID=A0AAW9EI40_9ENTR|nr:MULTISPECIES: hypothetical protein [Citrobacter]AHY13579.1 hypothetical protein CFNIH1_19215 [Citrobacter freundii CFNIH1]EJD6093686.1 hypothetical protein [Citrobacter freundii]EKS9218006.1 hypothetical protein [Citrobacter freundii]EKX8778036.1 hypothetical protein [Citrobacter freundii]MBJ8412829.1 hypothetical protein [Citrobacter cronae]
MSTGIELMQHALGINERNRTPYRNYFLVGEGHTDNEKWEELVSDGLATSRPAPGFVGDGTLYHVTEKGEATAISALPEPKKRTRYEEYLDADSCQPFSEWLLGYRLPEVEYSRDGKCRMFRCSYDAAYGYPRRDVEGEWCDTKKAAKASYKEALRKSKQESAQ